MKLKSILLKAFFSLIPFVFLFLTSSIAKSQNKPIWVSLSHDNDILSLNVKTDRYYSFGALVEFAQLHKQIDTNQNNFSKWNKLHSVSLGFKAYTPDHYLENPLPEQQRPFLNHSFLTLEKMYSNQEVYFSYGLQIGTTEGLFNAGKLQNWIHDNFSGDVHVDGWENQIEQRPTLQLLFDWNIKIKDLKNHDLFFGSSQAIGNLFTFMEPQLFYRRNISDVIGFLPFEYNQEANRKLNVELSIGFRYEFYNGSLRGDYFNQVRPELESYIQKVLFTASGKLRYEWENFSFFYANFFNSKRLRNDANHIYGSLGMTIRIN